MPALHRLLLSCNLILENITKSANKTRAWILSTFAQSKAVVVRRELAASASRITLPFDGWKSGNELDLLGSERVECTSEQWQELR